MSIVATKWMVSIPSTIGNWRQHNTLLHDKLIALGFTQTLDTGQLDITANPSAIPTSGGITLGYRMYLCPDAASGTSPMYLKIVFKSGMGFVPNWDFIIGGPTTDGAGNITNSLSQTAFITSGTPSYLTTSYLNTTAMCYLVWDNVRGVLGIFLGEGLFKTAASVTSRTLGGIYTNQSYNWAIMGRGMDAAGAVKTDRLFSLGAVPGQNVITTGDVGYYPSYIRPLAKTIIYGGTEVATENYVNAVWPEEYAAMYGKVPIAGTYLYWPDIGIVINPSVLYASNEDFVTQNPYPINYAGATRKYMLVGPTFLTGVATSLSSNIQKSRRYLSVMVETDGVWV